MLFIQNHVFVPLFHMSLCSMSAKAAGSWNKWCANQKLYLSLVHPLLPCYEAMQSFLLNKHTHTPPQQPSLPQFPNNWSRWTKWSDAEWKESQLFLKQKLVYAFDHPCPSLNIFQIYNIISERKGPGLHTVSKVWVQHGFVWVRNDAFCFDLYSFISSSEFLTLYLLFWLLPRTEQKFSLLPIKARSGNDSSQSPSVYIWRRDWISLLCIYLHWILPSC